MMPLIGCFVIFFGIGNRIKGMTLGVVNDETLFLSDCYNSSLKTFEVHNFDCLHFKISCDFIREFDQSVAELVSNRFVCLELPI
jgi:hypothetical protein